MNGPLAGVKVLDMSQIVSGPMAGAWLADQGADVVKLENPSGDPVRVVGARKGDTSAIYVAVNRGKRGETLDLKNPDDHPRFEEGNSGPYASLRAYDPVVQAASGLCAIQAEPDGTPRLMGTLVCDKVTALTAAQAITAALFARERTGQGQRIDIAMLDAALAFNWVEGMYNLAFVEPGDPALEYAQLGRLWPAKDGWVSCSALQDVEFRALREALGNPPELMDPSFDTAAGRAGRLARAEVLDDPQVRHNRLIVEVDQGAIGPVRVARHPIRFSETPAVEQPGPAPSLPPRARR